jgi:hypothetical protein
MSNVSAIVPESLGPWEMTVAGAAGAVLGAAVGAVADDGLVAAGLGVGGLVSSTVTPGIRTKIQPGTILSGR